MPIMMFAGLAFFLTSFAAWGTHVIWAILKLSSDDAATTGQIILGVLGSFVPPVGVVHGLTIWLGLGVS